MNDVDIKSYLHRLIDGHKVRITPRGEEYLTPSQAKVYKITKDIFERTNKTNVSGKEVKAAYRKRYNKDMQLLLSDFCYDLVNIAPDFEAKFFFYKNRGEFEFVDFFANNDISIPIIWNPKGRNVPDQLSGRKFCVGKYHQGKYYWDFRKLLAL